MTEIVLGQLPRRSSQQGMTKGVWENDLKCDCSNLDLLVPISKNPSSQKR